MSTRIEKDSMGEMPVPAEALYGASTQRAVLNFPVSGRPVPYPVVHAYGSSSGPPPRCTPTSASSPLTRPL